MTCGDYAHTSLSSASPEPTAPRSPTPGYARPCFSPAYTTDSYAPAWPNSPTPTHPHHRDYTPPTAYNTALNTLTQQAGLAA
jgi:hypothetical protein